MRRGGLRAWLVGITAGLAVGLLAIALAGLGVLLVAALVVGATISRPRLASLGGTLLGLGIGYLFLFGMAASRCESLSCSGPDPTPWVAIDAALLGAGLIASLGTLRASRA
jgi:hypothetical protein